MCAVRAGSAYDGIVAASGGTHTTVDASIDDGSITTFVKAGQSVAGFTMDVDNTSVELGNGVTVTSDINITGNNCELIMGPGS